ncbi:hypothetical protein FN846DRAFT_774653 [Sphaerosporella brunnea]|uniref:Myb-like domain-containing protein n=1 Tax=Sphaerosporella brunnea TaxID=1250544 RepID=A0A5J5F4I5_9PEZI|nr:hypothetical protein FN846DRAFT_774653 [Sphaerosporella brunnea]
MLLPSALPCDFLAPSLARAPVAPYHSPPIEDIGIVSATTGLLQTCRRLQHILSGGDRLSPSPIPLGPSQQSQEPPRTPVRRAPAAPRLPIKTPVRTNKRTRTDAFSPSSEESDNSDKDFNRRDRFATPPRGKRVRLTTPPPAPNRGIRSLLPDSDDEEDTVMWTDDDDRQLVEMVLGKLRLTKSDWEECARTLGKDSRSVGKRWENLLGNIVVKGVDRRRRIAQRRRIMPRN